MTCTCVGMIAGFFPDWGEDYWQRKQRWISAAPVCEVTSSADANLNAFCIPSASALLGLPQWQQIEVESVLSVCHEGLFSPEVDSVAEKFCVLNSFYWSARCFFHCQRACHSPSYLLCLQGLITQERENDFSCWKQQNICVCDPSAQLPRSLRVCLVDLRPCVLIHFFFLTKYCTTAHSSVPFPVETPPQSFWLVTAGPKGVFQWRHKELHAGPTFHYGNSAASIVF